MSETPAGAVVDRMPGLFMQVVIATILGLLVGIYIRRHLLLTLPGQQSFFSD